MIKWIGQHIWDFVSRFRNDVYLENLTTTTESNVLVVDSDGKVSKSTSVGGDITGVTAGTNCSGGGTTGNVTINVDDAFLINSGDDTTTGTITAGGFTTTGTWTFDEYTSGTVGITTVQDSGTTFNDNDTSLMTAAAIDDRILSYGYSTTAGTITGVTITTDTGGGSAASDTSGSADFSILGSNGVGVTNSGTTITAQAVPGEIDHNSLLNHSAAEHYNWSSDISGTATIHTNNITDLHGAGVNGSVNQLLTDNGDGTVTSEANLTFLTQANTPELTLSSAVYGPEFYLRNESDTAGNVPVLYFQNHRGSSATDSVDGDDLGSIYFAGYDDGSPNEQIYAEIFSEIIDSANNGERGRLELKVAEYDGTRTTGLKLDGQDQDGEVDVTIGAGANSTTTIAGDLTITGGNITNGITFDSGITNSGTIAAGTWNGTAITHDYIGLDAIDGTNIADDSINSDHYVNGSIDTEHIADDQVTYAKIQNVSATDRILGRDSAGAGEIEEITPANLRTMINVEDGATADQTQSDINGLAITTVGALNSGSITSGFGNIDTGSSTIDTTGAVSTGTLTADQIKHEISGSLTAGDIGHGAEVLYGIGTTNVDAGRIYTLHGGTWEEINAGNEDDSSGLMAVASIAAGSGNSSNGMIIKGCVTLENAYVSTTNEELGAIVYASTTNGRATTVMPSSSNDFVRILGYSLNVSNKKMFFNPDTTYIQRQ